MKPEALAASLRQAPRPRHSPSPLPPLSLSLLPPQTFQRLLNTQPLEYSCSSACVTGLLASSCEQCGGEDACGAFALSGGVLQAAECVVDAAI